ncbi:hypothetical protein B6U81_01060 [Thermoplasmatales archaeon ex4484_30]|nr:MAG: hypothetical protein B6U81_01060 [Thermoplasmatales archaeon ex4484_30]
MPLIIRREWIHKEYSKAPPDASPFYVLVPQSYLSEAYSVADGDKILAKILEVKKGEEEFEELKEKEIKLIFMSGAIYDYLFISREDWEKNFREYGLVEPNFVISLKLIEILYSTGERSKIYTKRDIEI